VIPRAIRHTGIDRQGSVVTPVQVVAVGESSLAVWMDDGTGPRIRALVPFPEVAAILDRNILLLGRLEIVSGGEPVVVHFNTVGRPELRWLLLGLRRSFSPVAAGLPGGVGRDPAELPHKWMALLASTEVQPLGRELLVAAAGDLADPKPRLHNGVAVLTSRELLVATDPTPDLTLPQYGIDLLAVPRSRVTSIGGGGRMLRVGVAAPDGPVELRVEADPSLVHAATTILGPLIGSA
jgi:hypothetical protein